MKLSSSPTKPQSTASRMPQREPTSLAKKAATSSSIRLAKARKKTAHSVEWFGDKTVHTTEGTVEDVGEGTKTVAVKTADGTKEAFEVSGHATVDTGKTVGRYSALGAKKGEHVTVYYTEEAGKKSPTSSSTCDASLNRVTPRAVCEQDSIRSQRASPPSVF